MGSGLNNRAEVFRGLSVLSCFPERTNYEEQSKILSFFTMPPQNTPACLGDV